MLGSLVEKDLRSCIFSLFDARIHPTPRGGIVVPKASEGVLEDRSF